MEYREKMVDRQVGRNADLFAAAIAGIPTKEERYPFIRILVGIIEQVHKEWNQAPNKDRQIANLVFRMSKGAVSVDEVSEIVRLRDQERGYAPIPDSAKAAAAAKAKESEKSDEAKAGEAKSDEGEAGDAQSGEAKSREARSDGGKSGEAKSEDGKAGEAKSDEGKAPSEDAAGEAAKRSRAKSDSKGDQEDENASENLGDTSGPGGTLFD